MAPCQGHLWVLCCASVCALRVCDHAVGHIGVLCHNKGGWPPHSDPLGHRRTPRAPVGCPHPTQGARSPHLLQCPVWRRPQPPPCLSFPNPMHGHSGVPPALWGSPPGARGVPVLLSSTGSCRVSGCGAGGLLRVGKLRQGETKRCPGRGCPQPRATHGRSPNLGRSLRWRSVGRWGARRCGAGLGSVGEGPGGTQEAPVSLARAAETWRSRVMCGGAGKG